MSVGKVVFYDQEERYRVRLAEYMRKQNQLPFRFTVFSKEELLIREMAADQESLCLVTGADLTEQIRRYDRKRLIILQDEQTFMPSETGMQIGKYQEADKILKDLKGFYEKCHPEISAFMNSGKTGKLIGVYSPVGRCGKTTFSVLCALTLSGRGRTLYLTLDEFSELRELISGLWTRDFSDLICAFKENPDNLIRSVKEIRQSFQELDYIPPMMNARELSFVVSKDWRRFFEILQAWGEYEYIVLDIGNVVADVSGILELCQKIYQPVANDRLSLIKVKEWETFLEKTGRLDLMMRREKICLPMPQDIGEEDFFQAGLVSEVGDYVRSIV